MKYGIVEDTSRGRLMTLINDDIKAGWSPVGGISVSAWIYNDGKSEALATLYCQAMILKEDGDK